MGVVSGSTPPVRVIPAREIGAPVDGAARQDDAPPAVVGRHSDGRWGLGALSVQPLSPVLAPQPGMTGPLVGGSFL